MVGSDQRGSARARALGRGLVCVALGLSAGCGERLSLDLADADDGWKIIAAVDARDRLTRTLGTLRVEAGRRVSGPRLDLRLERDERPVLVELDPSALSHPLGPVDGPRLELLPFDVDPAPALDGARLRVRDRLPRFTAGLRVFGPDGVFRPAPAPRRARLLGGMLLERSIDTEACPAPVGPLELVVPGVENLFDALPDSRARDSPVSGLRAPEPGVLVVLGRAAMMVLRDGARPTPRAPAGPPPRDWLIATDFGDDAARLERLLALPDGRLLAAGWAPSGGRVWILELGARGLEIVDTASVGPQRLVAATAFGSRLAVADEVGVGFVADRPEGPWTRIPAPPDDQVFFVELAGTPDGRLARAVDTRVELLFGDGWPRPARLDGPGLRSSLVEPLLWDGDRLFAGAEEGDLFVVEAGVGRRYALTVPPRLQACAAEPLPPEAVHVRQKIQSLVRVGGHLLVMFDRCSAVLAQRLEDGCGGLLLREGEPDPVPRLFDYEGLFLADDHLFVAGDDGLLLRAELRPPR